MSQTKFTVEHGQKVHCVACGNLYTWHTTTGFPYVAEYDGRPHAIHCKKLRQNVAAARREARPQEETGSLFDG